MPCHLRSIFVSVVAVAFLVSACSISDQTAPVAESSSTQDGSVASVDPVAAVAVSPTMAAAVIGLSTNLKATIRDAAGIVLTGRTITWSSNNTAVAAVSSSGVVSGLGVGSAAITATCEGKSSTAAITVDGTLGCGTPWPSAVYARMPLSTGKAFFVAPYGNDANPGTLGAPWKTLQKALTTLQAGQTAYLRAGTYGAFCTTSTFSGAGTASAPITVSGYPNERAVIHGQIRIDGSYFRLTHITAEGPTCGTWGATTRQGDNMILMTPGLTNHVEVSNSEVYHDGWHAGVSPGGDDIWILNNYIHDNGGFNDTTQYNTSHGIYYQAGTRGVVANNILEHNRAKGLSARYNNSHILVINNTVVGNGRSGLDITDSTYDWTFANNIVMNNGNVNGGVGINTEGSIGGANNVEVNNIFWNNGTSGSSNWDTYPTRTNNVVANPLFVNPVSSVPSTTHLGSSNDYHLLTGSPALGFASRTYALPFAFSWTCRPRGNGPDAGAYEQ